MIFKGDLGLTVGLLWWYFFEGKMKNSAVVNNLSRVLSVLILQKNLFDQDENHKNQKKKHESESKNIRIKINQKTTLTYFFIIFL